MILKRPVALLMALAMLFGACGGGEDSTGSTTSTATPPTSAASSTSTSTSSTTSTTVAVTTTAAAPTTTQATSTTAGSAGGAVAIPASPASAVLNQSYTFQGGTPEPELLPAEPGTVEARPHRVGVVYAVAYVGLDPQATACPGNSILTSAGFDFASNAELEGAECSSFPTLIESNDEQGLRICNDTVVYLSLIPSDLAGQLFSSIEVPVADIGGVGLTGSVAVTDPTTVPELDLGSIGC